jgi:hypothetical protein
MLKLSIHARRLSSPDDPLRHCRDMFDLALVLPGASSMQILKHQQALSRMLAARLQYQCVLMIGDGPHPARFMS